MRVTRLYYLIAPSVALVLATTACPSAHKPTAAVPPKQATPPAITAEAPAPKPAVSETKAPEEVKPVAPQPPPDPVAELVAKAEAEYQAGQGHNKSGDLEGAKVSFNRALDLLMNSPSELHSDQRWQQEYDKIEADAGRIEAQAKAQDENSTAQKAEPAPIDEANEATPSVDANVKAKAEAEIKATHSDLPLMLTDQVAGFINYFSNRGHGTLERALTRSGRYQEMIQRILKEEGVPPEMIYLAQAESGFYPFAVSRAGARGMWQFMASRGRAYGLLRNPWLDERQDPEKSTRAAARHLKDLYNQFGDWYLVMAAYNSGPVTVQQAVKRTGYADFWELYKRDVLPKETRNYVPIILAVTIMAKNPAQYGLDDVVPETPLRYDTLPIDYPVDLRLVAQCVDAPVGTLQDLNPSLLRWTTPKDGAFELHLPEGTKDKYLSAVAAIPPDMRVWWRYHSVTSGDTLASVARVYHVTPQALAKANHLEGEELAADSKLVIPLAPGRRLAMEDGTYARRITRYKVRKGDTVLTVAENFGIPVLMVRRWNHLKGDGLGGRRILYLHLPVAPGIHAAPQQVASKRSKRQTNLAKSNNINALPLSAKDSVVHHKVKPGETLYSIASLYNTTVAALQRDNHNVNPLRAGAVLVVRGPQ